MFPTIRAACLSFALLGGPALAQENAGAGDDLAMKLANPIASLISVPLQSNWDFGYGADGKGHRYTLNIQPVVPISLNSDWNVISRTILPIISQRNVTGSGVSQAGLGDTVQSLFFSPKATTASGITWGAGPVFLVPTATDRALGAGKLGIGPTAVVLKQSGPVTLGLLANHIWSVAGRDSRADVSATFLNPFASYVTKRATTFSVAPEFTHDWNSKAWLIPVNVTVSQLLRVGQQPVSVGVAGRAYLDSPAGGPDWGLRMSVVFLFPTK